VPLDRRDFLKYSGLAAMTASGTGFREVEMAVAYELSSKAA
jgi:hypothetical protein